MIAKIKVVSLFKFGSADVLQLRLNADDLSTQAVFLWQLGRMDGEQFVAADGVCGNLIVSGGVYASWDGSNSGALAIVAPLIPVSLA